MNERRSDRPVAARPRKKVIVGKHRQRTGYRRRNGHRSRLSRIEIQSIGKQAARSTAKKAPAKKTETEKK